MARRVPKRHIRIGRDLVLFICGLAGVVYETTVEHADRPYLLAVFAGMLGLPTFLGRDDPPDDDDDRPGPPSSNGSHRA